jgi:hypothetical protein
VVLVRDDPPALLLRNPSRSRSRLSGRWARPPGVSHRRRTQAKASSVPAVTSISTISKLPPSACQAKNPGHASR